MSVCNVKVAFIRPRYNDLREWCDDEDNVYIGRRGIVFISTEQGKERYPKVDSIWANPFKLSDKNDRESVLSSYEAYIREKLESGDISLSELEKLRGKNLGCWCAPCGCHGDILLRLINELL